MAFRIEVRSQSSWVSKKFERNYHGCALYIGVPVDLNCEEECDPEGEPVN